MLKRRTPLRVNHANRKRSKTKYAKRPRAFGYMGWIKQQSCIVRQFAVVMKSPTTPCRGDIEADHMGERGLGRKAPDSTCVPICSGHHRERTDFSGAFKTFTQMDMRSFVASAIQVTQNRARHLGVEVPAC